MTVEQAGAFAGDVHVLPIRVYYEDTDAAGMVYYANYLKYIERARTDLLRLLGVSHSRMMAEGQGSFAVRRCDIHYVAPARLDDMLEVHTRLLALRGASLDAEQIVKRDGGDIARATLGLAFLGPHGRPRRLPAEVRAAIEAMPAFRN